MDIWDTITGQPLHTLTGHIGSVRAAGWSPDGARLVTTDGAWRWLGWNMIEDGRLLTLPAETYDLLPPLDRPREIGEDQG